MSNPASAPKHASSRRKGLWTFLALVVIAVGIFVIWKRLHPGPPKIPFAPYGEDYSSKPDFAEVEYRFPLSAEQRMGLTPEILKSYDQEQIEQIYARLTAGPIPDGVYNGDLFFPKGMSGRKRLGEVVGGLKGWAANFELDKLTLLGRALWKGKVFYRDQRVLRNRIDDLGFFDQFFPDPADKAELQNLITHPTPENQYFPAKLYCGQSLLDSRRESVIIDYAFTDELPGYRKVPDKLAGREFLVVRDEIRMVRPGFYLGRAYMAGSFILNFTLYKDDVAKAGAADFLNTNKTVEDCWTGLQRAAAP